MPSPGVDPLATPCLDPATIERVVAMDDVVKRDAAITRGYHDLAHAVAAVVGWDHANWLVFGQWASAEARRSMVGEAVPALLRPLIGPGVAAVADPFVRAAVPGRWIAAIIATSHMGLRVPEGVLELGRDVPPPAYLGGPRFPPELEVLDDLEAVAPAARFEQDLASAAHSDAPDWESYDERMGFIFTLLRSQQCDPELFDLPPGTPEAAVP